MEKQKELKKGWIIAALMLTMALAAMDSTIVSTVIPQIVSDLGGFTKFSWVFSIYLLTQTVTIPLYGKLADMFGRKKILLFGIIVFLIGSATSAMSWDITSLIIFRGIQGLGAGSIMANVNTIAGDIYSVEERAKIQGYLSSIWGISAILSPALGGVLVEFADWRWIFIINIPIGLLSFGFIFWFFKEEFTPKRSAVDYKGAVFITLTLGLIFIFLMEGGQSWSWASKISLAIFVAIIVFSIISYRIEKRATNAIMPFWVWKNKTLIFNNLAVILMGMIMIGPETFIPTFAQTSLGLGTILSGFVLASMSLGWPVSSAYSGRFYMKIGFRNTSLIGAYLVLLACVGFLVIPSPKSTVLLIIDMVLLGAGFGLISTPTLVGIQSMVGWEHRGVVTSANMFCRNLGQSLGAVVFGAVFNNSFLNLLKKAPADIPQSTNDILGTINSPTISHGSKEFLKNAIANSMNHIYLGLVIFAIIMIIMFLNVPQRNIKDTSLIEVDDI